MPFDGIVTKSIVSELSEIITGGRVEKVFQPEPDEIIINIRSKGQNLKLLLSASSSYPRIHITSSVKENPAAPPVFCMLLRKHLTGGKILGVDFFDYERIINLRIESTNELGDTSVKKLIIEIMGRHSNIILTNEEGKIIDSVKHVDSEISSVREVMPARNYVLPPSQDKISPDTLDINKLISEEGLRGDIETSIEKYLLNNIKGFSPLLCSEICCRANIDGKILAADLPYESLLQLKQVLSEIIDTIINCRFSPCIIFSNDKNDVPIDFHCLEIRHRGSFVYSESISNALDSFYSAKDKSERLRQKKSDVLKVLNNGIDRCRKKLAMHQDTLREVADREKLKLYGELITANIYCIPPNVKSVSLLNYYSDTGEYINIPVDEYSTPQQNAQRYFKKYSKAKNTFLFTSKQLDETNKELDYLEGVLHLLDNCSSVQEIGEIRQELIEQGYILSKKRGPSKKREKLTQPLHYKSSDGLDIYVGKNNRQNDTLTLKSASSNDIWLHTRNIPGSHVIIKKKEKPVPDSTLLEAAILSAYHSKARMSANVPVDYTTVRNVKKPSGAKPGMVIYNEFKTIIVTPDEKVAKNLKAE